MRAYEKAKTHANYKLDQLRSKLQSQLSPEFTAVTYGSYARREASDQSDIDYIVIGPTPKDEASERKLMEGVEEIVGSVVPIEPSAGGAFAKYVDRDDIVTGLGGSQDSNDRITRRLLLLLEGEWLANENVFQSLRYDLIKKYVKATTKDHQLCLFLLNDIIRYWRTMTVDYMYKTTEETNPKPWAIRNIKLVFSRKLMYASGLFSVGLTVDRGEEKKVEILDMLFSMPVIERMTYICGEMNLKGLLSCYDLFLERIERKEVREALKEVSADDHRDPIFRELKNEGHYFTRELLIAFENTFHSTHPIRRAVIF